jgi:hypothetical protein
VRCLSTPCPDFCVCCSLASMPVNVSSFMSVSPLYCRPLGDRRPFECGSPDSALLRGWSPAPRTQP